MDSSNTKLADKLKSMQANRSALLATNFYNFETLRGVLEAARRVQLPLILQLTQSSIDYMRLPVAVSMAREALRSFGVQGWIHLDHAHSYELVVQCLDAGFDSVMIDASEKPLEDNISITRKVVEVARRYDACVEAELGYVAKLGQSHNQSGFTEPEEAAYFVKETGVNALAVAIGTAHGFYKEEPKLDLERLSRIHELIDVSLVLHGSSGIPATSIAEAVNRGICKINLATEIKNIFMLTLKSQLQNNDEIDLRKVFPPAIESITKLVEEKLLIAENKSPGHE
jgi:fructose-bisphosphate aldolase class II/tagatose 1,6-diphosphate aldolase GatY/KbaY